MPAAPRIPLEHLFGNPDRMSPEVSPDGTTLAWIAPVKGVLNVWVRPLAEDGPGRPVTTDTERGIRFYSWAHDNKHLLYLQDQGGNENWRIFATEVASGRTRDLTPYENVQAQWLAHVPEHPDTLLVALNKDNEKLHDVYRVSISTGEITLTEQNPGGVDHWVADLDLHVRAMVQDAGGGAFALQVRDTPGGAWRHVLTWDADDAMTSRPVCFTADGDLLLRESRGVNAMRLMRYHLADGAFTCVAEDPQAEVGGLLLHHKTREPQAVSFERARTEWRVLDETLLETFEALKALQRGDLFIASRDDADRTWIVGFDCDDQPANFYRFDSASGEVAFLFTTRPELKDATLAQMEPFTFTARDGLKVQGYVTFPAGMEKSNLPAVLNVHGGPWARDSWGYDPESQWIANRGWLSIQVNYRGSTGYGKAFLNAADRQWGARMHDDLVDAVAFVVEKGWADPKRIAIFGGSYGGYAALCGVTFTPDLFCCSVAIVGPSNLISFIQTIPPYWSNFLDTFKRRVGDPETEAEFLKSRSPLTFVDRICRPLLIAHGANDPRVKQSESEQIVAALKAKGIDHQYMLFPDEGHGFAKPANRLTFYAAAEAFLAKHLAR